MRIFCFDTETTGIPNFKLPADRDEQPRICQIAAALVDSVTLQDLVPPLYSLVKPENWPPMEPGAEKAHGITLEKCEAEGRPIKKLLSLINYRLDDAELIVGANPTFDLKMLRGAFRRAGMPDRYGEVKHYCVLRRATPICKLPPTPKMRQCGMFGYKTPSLSQACKSVLGEDLEGAHDAMNDVRATLRLYRELERLREAELKGEVKRAS